MLATTSFQRGYDGTRGSVMVRQFRVSAHLPSTTQTFLIESCISFRNGPRTNQGFPDSLDLDLPRTNDFPNAILEHTPSARTHHNNICCAQYARPELRVHNSRNKSSSKNLTIHTFPAMTSSIPKSLLTGVSFQVEILEWRTYTVLRVQ